MCIFITDSDESHQSNTTTTIVGVTYDDGVILGSTDIITQLTANVFLCHCALGADTQVLLEDARNFLDQETTATVAAEIVGMVLSAYDINNKKNMLQTGVLLGGWDKNGGGKIYEIGFSGVVMEKSNFGVGGYGAVDLNDFLEKEWKKGMTEEEAEQLVVKALSLNNNINSACGVQTASVNSKGFTTAFHPYGTLPINAEKLELEHMNEKYLGKLELEHANEKPLLEYIRAHLLLLLNINEGL